MTLGGRRRRRKKDLGGLAMAMAGLLLLEAVRQGANFGDTIVHLTLISAGVFAVALTLAWFVQKQKRDKLRVALLAAGTTNPLQLTPEQYEQFCAALLSHNGWKTRLTRKSGDFGADVIATKEDRVLVIQPVCAGIPAIQGGEGSHRDFLRS